MSRAAIPAQLLIVIYVILCLARFATLRAPLDLQRTSTVVLERLTPSDHFVDVALKGLARSLDRMSSPASLGSSDVTEYEKSLRRARALFVRALRSSPLNSRAMQGLAAVTWELGFFEPANRELVERLIALAMSTAPRDEETLRRVSNLLVHMGRIDDAAEVLARLVTLAPSHAAEAVSILENGGYSLEQIAHALPWDASVVTALAPRFFLGHRELDFVDLVEKDLATSPGSVTRAYGEACLRSGSAARLVSTLASLGPYTDSVDEATRMTYLARGYAVVGRADDAVSAIRKAERLAPSDPAICEAAGEVFRSVGDFPESVASYMEALRVLAKNGGLAKTRARVYAELGRTYEAEQLTDQAIDAYQRALALEPSDIDDLRIPAYVSSAGTHR